MLKWTPKIGLTMISSLSPRLSVFHPRYDWRTWHGSFGTHGFMEPRVICRDDCSLWGLIQSMSCTPMSSHMVIFYWVCRHTLAMVHYHFCSQHGSLTTFSSLHVFWVVHVFWGKNTTWVQNAQNNSQAKPIWKICDWWNIKGVFTIAHLFMQCTPEVKKKYNMGSKLAEKNHEQDPCH